MDEIRDMGLLQGFGCTKCKNRHFYGGFVLTLFPHDGGHAGEMDLLGIIGVNHRG